MKNKTKRKQDRLRHRKRTHKKFRGKGKK